MRSQILGVIHSSVIVAACLGLLFFYETLSSIGALFMIGLIMMIGLHWLDRRLRGSSDA